MGGGGGQKQTTNEVKEVKLPAWVDKASQENYGRAQGIANQPYDPYAGDKVAPLDPAFWQAYQGMGSLGDMMGAYGQTGNALAGMLGYNPGNIEAPELRAGQLSETDLNPYLNPYIQNVEDRAISNAERSGKLAQNQLATEAQQKGAFGGSRQAMQQAVQGAETTRGIGDLSAKLRKEGYDAATANALADIKARDAAGTTTGNWRMEAQKATVANQLDAMRAKTGAAQQLTSTADAYQKARMQEIQTAVAMGQISQEQAQRMIDQEVAKHEGPRNYELENLNILLASLGMSPYGHTETGSSTTKSSGGGGGLGDIMNMAFGGAKMLAGLSDRDEKTNIELLDDSGLLPVYAYDYKSDVKAAKKTKRAMPMKRVGPMAQDVEKIAPHLVRKVGGKRVIDMTGL